IHGNMCCGVLKDELEPRLEPERAQELLRRPPRGRWTFTGRPLKGFVFIESGGLRINRQLRDWVATARSFAGTLPPKPASKSAARGSRAVKRGGARRG